ncbi:hypothetical protein A2U01_0099400, partial [Trifolium medium]|nr:hypothetical protein [Trifolium medium]
PAYPALLPGEGLREEQAQGETRKSLETPHLARKDEQDIPRGDAPLEGSLPHDISDDARQL